MSDAPIAAGLSTRPTTSTSVAASPVPMLSTSPMATSVLFAALTSATASSGAVGNRPSSRSCHCRSGSRETSEMSAEAATCTPSRLTVSIA